MKEIRLPNGVWEYDETTPLGKPGGFGQVFLGKATTDDEVAVKRLHLTAASAAHREMAIAEELVGKDHDHVIRFLDAGEDADSGYYFVVMEKAEMSLEDELVAKGTIEPASVAEILFQAASGLLEVGKLVHRDIKPGNILRHEGRWKLADFGIARFVADATASNTLKGYLSEGFAAPEQWRFERATTASDIYSLGCVGFALLTGHQPYSRDPSDEHQHAPLPAFACSDSRLSGLIKMMVRKQPATRPSIERVLSILGTIKESPPPGQSAAGGILAAAGAQVAERIQAEQAAEEVSKTLANNRRAILDHGFDVLRQSAEELWQKIESAAPAAQRTPQGRQRFSCSLGRGTLVINFANSSNAMEEGLFRQSKWDMVGAAQMLVLQNEPKAGWPSTLWFGKRPGTEDYRWYEIVFMHNAFSGRYGLIEVTDSKDADFALSNMMHSVDVAYGPHSIDDENEDKFHERCQWLLARAATGNLRLPSSLPINGWPPSM
jgi:eukaryotic-like serine/threonine-protein kinase